MPNEIDLTPNYTRMFRIFISEARMQGNPEYLFTDLRRGDARVNALREVQRFLGPLAIAAQCMTSVVEIEQFRAVIADINSAIDKAASELEHAVDDQEEVAGE